MTKLMVAEHRKEAFLFKSFPRSKLILTSLVKASLKHLVPLCQSNRYPEPHLIISFLAYTVYLS